MQKLTFNITIDAPREKVWNVLWGKETYNEWVRAFGDGSTVLTDWKKGSKVRFVDSNNEGMLSQITDLIANEYMEFTHQGITMNGKDDYDSAHAQGWAGAKESYTLKDVNGKTELHVFSEITEEHVDSFRKIWPQALDTVKKLSEN